MTALQAILLLAAGFAGGTVNAIAGGATFFTFPAMLAVGIPPVAANASNTVALFPASLVAAIALRRELATTRRHLLRLVLIGIVGGIAGAVLLLATPDRAFLVLVPWLLLLATSVFAFSPRLLAWCAPRASADGGFRLGAAMLVLVAVCSVYGGYFGAGVGIMLMAGLDLAGLDDPHAANALKNLHGGGHQRRRRARLRGRGHGRLAGCPGHAGRCGGRRRVRCQARQRLPPRLFRGIVIGVGSLLTVWYFIRA